jgi:N-acetyltransferase
VIPLDDILDSLDLSRAQPGSGFLEALFTRFNARVPFENASKIVRDADVADPAGKPRTPDVFWADHLSSGAGGTCFARVAAFGALLEELGFRTRRVLGRVLNPGDHAALLVETRDGETIADVGFPLPALLPARACLVETPLCDVRVAATALGFALTFEGGVPEGPRSLEVFSSGVPESEYLECWRRTFQHPSTFLGEVSLRVDRGNRVLAFARGEARVDDLHSRLRVPLCVPHAAALAPLFGIDEELLARAFEIAGDPPPGSPDTTLTAYLESASSAADAFSAIATSEGYRRLLAGIAEVSAAEETGSGFRLTLSSGGSEPRAALEEEVSPDPSTQRLAVTRRAGGAEHRSCYRAEEREGKTYLVREATLAGVREDLLRNDSLRGRLAGTLAVDLLAWGRMLNPA